MKKSERIAQYEKAYEIFNKAIESKDKEKLEYGTDFITPLRSCQARVYETDNFYLLLSYNTFVAAIEKSNGNMADVLRTEYGYTATSAQHISKFFHDYAVYNPTKIFTAYPID